MDETNHYDGLILAAAFLSAANHNNHD